MSGTRSFIRSFIFNTVSNIVLRNIWILQKILSDRFKSTDELDEDSPEYEFYYPIGKTDLRVFSVLINRVSKKHRPHDKFAAS